MLSARARESSRACPARATNFVYIPYYKYDITLRHSGPSCRQLFEWAEREEIIYQTDTKTMRLISLKIQTYVGTPPPQTRSLVKWYSYRYRCLQFIIHFRGEIETKHGERGNDKEANCRTRLKENDQTSCHMVLLLCLFELSASRSPLCSVMRRGTAALKSNGKNIYCFASLY